MVCRPGSGRGLAALSSFLRQLPNSFSNLAAISTRAKNIMAPEPLGSNEHPSNDRAERPA